MNVTVFPDGIYRDSRANAPCPLDHASITGWTNTIIYTTFSQLSPVARVGPLSIKCVFRGKETYEIAGSRYTVANNSYLIVNDRQPYVCEIDSNTATESLTVFFQREFAEEVLSVLVSPADRLLESGGNTVHQPVRFFEKLYRHDRILSPLLFNLYFLIANGKGAPGYFTEQFSVLLGKMLLVHRGISAEIARLPNVRSATRVELYRRLHRAKDYLDSCYQQPIQLSQMAHIAQLSQYHFLRMFKQAFNETPHRYLTRRRLESARDLLATSDLPITQVCYEAGFEDLSSFGRRFRQYSGLSPRAFRAHEARRK